MIENTLKIRCRSGIGDGCRKKQEIGSVLKKRLRASILDGAEYASLPRISEGD